MTTGDGTFCMTCDWLDNWGLERLHPGDVGYTKATDPDVIRARHKRDGECPDTVGLRVHVDRRDAA